MQTEVGLKIIMGFVIILVVFFMFTYLLGGIGPAQIFDFFQDFFTIIASRIISGVHVVLR